MPDMFQKHPEDNVAGGERMRIGAGAEKEDKVIERECWEVGSPDREDLSGHYKEFDFHL